MLFVIEIMHMYTTGAILGRATDSRYIAVE